MAVDEIQAMRQAYRHTADFIYVYISEAHAGDEWPLGRLQDWDLIDKIEYAFGGTRDPAPASFRCQDFI